jgi:hypothetical protein
MGKKLRPVREEAREGIWKRDGKEEGKGFSLGI